MSTRITCAANTIFTALCLTLLSQSASLGQSVQVQPEVLHPLKHALTPPLRDIKPAPPVPGPPRVIQRLSPHPPRIMPAQQDPVLQTAQGAPVSATAGLNVDGMCDASRCGAASQADASGIAFVPPDTNGAVGDTQYVQWVNYAFAVFDKATGTLVGGPLTGSTWWKIGFGPQDSCAINNSGDPIVKYDKAAGRWVFTQPVFTKPFYICIAVSTTSDALGSYNVWKYPMSYFPDYPKLGIWPDGYYMSINQYTGLGAGGSFKGSLVCAFDRNAMVGGVTNALGKCLPVGSFESLLPSDLDGSTPPPAGSPNYFLNLGSDSQSLNLWQFHVDFTKPNLPYTLSTRPIPVAPFTEACGGKICIPQGGTNRRLDSLGDRLMYRLAYRNFPDHESLVVNHSVTAGSSVGVRWYEIRNPRSCIPQNPGSCDPKSCVYQQQTFAPDANFRWMGSVAMDKSGDLAIGYSKSSSSSYPSIYITGRMSTDPCNMLKAEQSVVPNPPAGPAGGSQLNVSNWGDYSSMSVDLDDCTFWYTTEYLQTSGNYNWHTRIASFKFPSCGALTLTSPSGSRMLHNR